MHLLKIPGWRQQLTDWKKKLLPLWIRYWPLFLLATGLIWLGLSLYQKTLDERLARYYELVEEAARLTKSGSQAGNAYLRGLQIGRQTAVLINLFTSIFLPYLLILSAIGQYQYWYVARYVLLTPGRAVKWGYGVVVAFVWFLLISVSITSLDKLAIRAGGVFILPTLTVGYVVVYAMLVHFRERQREEQDLAQSKRQAELDALKAQVNPPFLFHTLQGLHRTALDEQLPRTAQSLGQLTGIMQYVLEESRKQTTDVAREMGFINDYLRLQRLRVPERDNIRITTELNWDEKPANIVPLLLNPLIENAFKYGISIQHPCFVTIRFKVVEGVLVFLTENSILPRNDLERGTGLGLKNVRRRLELAYPDRHKLTVSSQNSVYRIELKIKLA